MSWKLVILPYKDDDLPLKQFTSLFLQTPAVDFALSAYCTIMYYSRPVMLSTTTKVNMIIFEIPWLQRPIDKNNLSLKNQNNFAV